MRVLGGFATRGNTSSLDVFVRALKSSNELSRPSPVTDPVVLLLQWRLRESHLDYRVIDSPLLDWCDDGRKGKYDRKASYITLILKVNALNVPKSSGIGFFDLRPEEIASAIEESLTPASRYDPEFGTLITADPMAVILKGLHSAETFSIHLWVGKDASLLVRSEAELTAHELQQALGSLFSRTNAPNSYLSDAIQSAIPNLRVRRLCSAPLAECLVNCASLFRTISRCRTLEESAPDISDETKTHWSCAGSPVVLFTPPADLLNLLKKLDGKVTLPAELSGDMSPRPMVQEGSGGSSESDVSREEICYSPPREVHTGDLQLRKPATKPFNIPTLSLDVSHGNIPTSPRQSHDRPTPVRAPEVTDGMAPSPGLSSNIEASSAQDLSELSRRSSPRRFLPTETEGSSSPAVEDRFSVSSDHPKSKLPPVTIPILSPLSRSAESPATSVQSPSNRAGTLARYRSIPSLIIPKKLFLAAEAVARSKATLRSRQITHIVNSAGDQCPNYFPNDFTYYQFIVPDTRLANGCMEGLLYSALDFIDNAIEKGGRVLVHCREGVSRSTTIVVAYLMWSLKLSFRDALNQVVSVRPSANPNTGFTFSLILYQKRLEAASNPGADTNCGATYLMRISINSIDAPFVTPNLIARFQDNNWSDPVQLDPRFFHIFRQQNKFIVWKGAQTPHSFISLSRLASNRYIEHCKKFERMASAVDAEEICQGEERQEFWAALGVKGPEAVCVTKKDLDLEAEFLRTRIPRAEIFDLKDWLALKHEEPVSDKLGKLRLPRPSRAFEVSQVDLPQEAPASRRILPVAAPANTWSGAGENPMRKWTPDSVYVFNLDRDSAEGQLLDDENCFLGSDVTMIFLKFGAEPPFKQELADEETEDRTLPRASTVAGFQSIGSTAEEATVDAVTPPGGRVKEPPMSASYVYFWEGSEVPERSDEERQGMIESFLDLHSLDPKKVTVSVEFEDRESQSFLAMIFL